MLNCLKRVFAVNTLLTASIAVVSGCATLDTEYDPKSDLTLVSWGGQYTVSQQKAYGKPWEQEHGKRLRWVNYNGGLEEVRKQVSSGEVGWDVIDVLGHEARVGCDEGLFEKIPTSWFSSADKAPSLEQDLIVNRPNDCVVPQIHWSYLTLYKQNSFGDVNPESIEDFFDLEKFPGKRGVQIWARGIIEMALVADGVDPADVYKVLDTVEGVDRAFAKLDSIKGNIIFWSKGVEPEIMVKNGKVAMSVGYSGRITSSVLKGDESVVPIWDGQLLEEEWLVILRGSPNKDTAMDFVRFAAAPMQQALQAKYIGYGPMRKSALEIIANNEPWYHNGRSVSEYLESRADVLPRSVIANSDWWAKNGEAIDARYKAWR